jgi:outer membrane protein
MSRLTTWHCKGYEVKRYRLWIILATITILAGCDSYVDDKRYAPEATRQKLRSIDTLDTESLRQTPEPNLPKPAEPNQAANEMKMTLEDCRAIALQNNLDIKTELISPAIAAQTLNAEKAKFEAVFFADGSYSKTETPSILTDVSRVNSQDLDAGVNIPLRTGGMLTFSASDNMTEDPDSSAALNSIYTANTRASISQPLLRNAGPDASMYSIRIAEYNRQISEAQTKLQIITVLSAADRVYWRLYAARRQLEVRKQQYDLAQAQLDKVKRLVAGGAVSQVEIIRAEAGVAERLGGIITAENVLRQRERELKRVLNKPGVPIDSKIALVPATEPNPVHYQPDRQRMVSHAIDNRMEMLELELQLAQNASSISYFKNQALPLLGLTYSYGVNGIGTTRNDAYDLLQHNKFNNNTVGLQFEMPLGNVAAMSRLEATYLERRQKLATKDSRKALIEQEVLNAIDQLDTSWQQIMAGRENSLLSGRLYQAEERQFKLGLRTSTDVLDAQTKFAEAQSQEIIALTEYQISLVDMAYATGTVLGSAKVDWAPDNTR